MLASLMLQSTNGNFDLLQENYLKQIQNQFVFQKSMKQNENINNNEPVDIILTIKDHDEIEKILHTNIINLLKKIIK